MTAGQPGRPDRAMRWTAARLGLRWAVRPSARGRAAMAQTLAGAALAAVVLVLTWAVIAGNAARMDRAMQRNPAPALEGAASFKSLINGTPDGNDVWTTEYLAGIRPDAPAPPGLAAFPRPGEVWVSPAVASRLRDHPERSSRLPGTVVGEIGAAGLQSPDELFAIVAVDPERLSAGSASAGWGTRWAPDQRPTVPTDGLLIIVGAIVGLPLLGFAAGVARLSAAERRRRAAALHLVGVPASVLSRAAATESGLQAAAGAVLGVLAAALALPKVAISGVAGIRWFPHDAPVTAFTVLLVALLLGIGIGALAAAGTRRVLANPLQSRQGAVSVRAFPRLLLASVGMTVMVAFMVLGATTDRSLSSGIMTLIALAGMIALTAGTVGSVAPTLQALGGFVAARSPRPAILIAARRLGFDATATARSATALVLLMVSSGVAAGVLLDIAAQNPLRVQGHVIQVSLPTGVSASEQRAIAALPVRARLFSTADDGSALTTTVRGECADVAALIGAGSADEGRAFARLCTEGGRYGLGRGTYADGVMPLGGIL